MTGHKPDFPPMAVIGSQGNWDLQTERDEPYAMVGTFLGMGSTHRDEHQQHLPGTHVTGRARCSACRWFEVRIFRIRNGRYAVHFAGRSIVPGDEQLCRIEEAMTAFEVVEVLTTRRRPNDNVDGPAAFLTVPAARALAQASAYDDDIRESYVNRAVS